MRVGYGGLFNHSDTPNLGLLVGPSTRMHYLPRTKDIIAGKPLTIDYRWGKRIKRSS